eukprot:663036-Pelagomonas_calceolata.AAC.9
MASNRQPHTKVDCTNLPLLVCSGRLCAHRAKATVHGTCSHVHPFSHSWRELLMHPSGPFIHGFHSWRVLMHPSGPFASIDGLYSLLYDLFHKASFWCRDLLGELLDGSCFVDRVFLRSCVCLAAALFEKSSSGNGSSTP